MKTFNLIIILGTLFLASCENDPGIEPSKETFLPKIELLGSPNVSLACGTTSYTDPGVNATENGAAVTPNVTIAPRYFGSSQINGADVYDISYVAVNVDGIPGATFRTVFIPPCNGDLVNSIEGVYTSTIVRTNSAGGTLTGPQYTNIKYVLIKKSGANTYQISDVIGGWYEFGRALGVAYAAPGATITANNIAANDFTFGDAATVGGFGGTATLTGFTVDAAAKKIVMSSTWDAGFKFVATLTQVN
ncbi:MAG TPA: hypothetical protein VK169_06825 [Saprospiraceae bacterium]|jgi:hypothetical protein|nr:hypothetical protein [Saprospiraceae bacterium]